jgi:mono/diheme cytochrome c family protein
MRSFILMAAVFFACCTNVNAGTELVIQIDGHQAVFSPDTLLKRADAKSISIPADPAYKKAVQYRAIPFSTLLKEQGVKSTDNLNFVALDGFAAPLPAAIILNAKASQAWLAIEPTTSTWPALSATKSNASAGPFYLVWVNPAADGITQEQWPYQIARIEKVASIENRFPMLLPDKSVSETSTIRKGFSVFQKNCMVCHKLNGGGDSSMGPDLNIPHNPTEYFQIAYLKKLIRNPKQVRSWPDSKMPGFDDKTISDQEVDALVDYLRHMKK